MRFPDPSTTVWVCTLSTTTCSNKLIILSIYSPFSAPRPWGYALVMVTSKDRCILTHWLKGHSRIPSSRSISPNSVDCFPRTIWLRKVFTSYSTLFELKHNILHEILIFRMYHYLEILDHIFTRSRCASSIMILPHPSWFVIFTFQMCPDRSAQELDNRLAAKGKRTRRYASAGKTPAQTA